MRHTMKCVYDNSIKAVEQTKGVREGDESLQPNGVHVDLMRAESLTDFIHYGRRQLRLRSTKSSAESTTEIKTCSDTVLAPTENMRPLSRNQIPYRDAR